MVDAEVDEIVDRGEREALYLEQRTHGARNVTRRLVIQDLIWVIQRLRAQRDSAVREAAK